MHRETDNYHIYDHDELIDIKTAADQEKEPDGMFSYRELSTDVQTHGECSVSNYTPSYSLFVNLY